MFGRTKKATISAATAALAVLIGGVSVTPPAQAARSAAAPGTAARVESDVPDIRAIMTPELVATRRTVAFPVALDFYIPEGDSVSRVLATYTVNGQEVGESAILKVGGGDEYVSGTGEWDGVAWGVGQAQIISTTIFYYDAETETEKRVTDSTMSNTFVVKEASYLFGSITRPTSDALQIKVQTGNRYSWKRDSTRDLARAAVVLQRLDGETWVDVADLVLNKTGKLRGRTLPVTPEPAQYRLLYAGNSTIAESQILSDGAI